uniref:Uncharacterized protein n=1 Tax=Anguilla anguilla TaxID=7936 RepID=A0A0E9VKA2_ANGAN
MSLSFTRPCISKSVLRNMTDVFPPYFIMKTFYRTILFSELDS